MSDKARVSALSNAFPISVVMFSGTCAATGKQTNRKTVIKKMLRKNCCIIQKFVLSKLHQKIKKVRKNLKLLAFPSQHKYTTKNIPEIVDMMLPKKETYCLKKLTH